MTASTVRLSRKVFRQDEFRCKAYTSAIRHKDAVGKLDHQRAMRAITAIGATTVNGC